MADEKSRLKWNNIYQQAAVGQAEPCTLLRDFVHLLPRVGDALDIACGLGGNALFMAHQGLQVTALDISEIAVQRINEYAHRRQLKIQAKTADFCVDPLPATPFDVIVVSHYLERRLGPLIAAALRPGGLLFYQTFVRDTVDRHAPQNVQFRLAPNELLQMFGG
ncbi:MAG: class I SAM-dependent methyltransferase, partial [Pseudomonadota bacterium]